MLGIQKLEHLARNLGTTQDRLIEVAETASSFCRELELVDPTKPHKKPREVLDVTGDLRLFQTRMLVDLLRPKHQPTIYSHGGVQGRHIKTNAIQHNKSVFVFTTDVSNFYPTISTKRVARLFLKDFCCHPDVARVCTKLCTYRHHLALGLITSPILADCVMKRTDLRIANMCTRHSMVYTRFIDDIIISGSFPIKSGSFPNLVTEILGSYGFKVNPEKHAGGLEGLGRLADGRQITKLQIRRGVIRVRQEFLREVKDQLLNAAKLGAGKDFHGFYYERNQILGRIHFVRWINQGQAIELERQYQLINWDRVGAEAKARGLVSVRKILRPRTTKLQDFAGDSQFMDDPQ